MRSGDRPGLQNRRVASSGVTGGFDPHSLPPIFRNLFLCSHSGSPVGSGYQSVFPLWHALFVAVNTLHIVDVVLAGFVLERRVHFFDVKLADLVLKVAAIARGPCLLSMLLVTREATEAFMDPRRSAVVARQHLSRGHRSVALIAQCLPLIRAGLHLPSPVEHGRERQVGHRNGVELTPLKESQRGPRQVFSRISADHIYL